MKRIEVHTKIEHLKPILDAVDSSGEKVFGKILVTPIENAINLGMGLRGSDALK